MFNIPELRTLILYAALPPLVAYAVTRRFGESLDSFITILFVALNSTYAVIMHLAGEFVRWERNLSDTPRPAYRNEPTAEPVKQYVNMNNIVHGFNVQSVKINARRHFFILLWRQYEYDPEQINLTEDYWLRNKPRKWKGKDNEFRDLKHECDGVIFERKDPNNKHSGYIIRDDIALRYAAANGSLPH